MSVDAQRSADRRGRALHLLPLTPELIREWVEQYRAGHDGRFPTQGAGPIGDTGKSWRWLDQVLRIGGYGWKPGSSLSAWLDTAYPERRLTFEMVRAWVDAFRASHDGRFPHANSGAVAGTTRKWAGVDSAMEGGLVGDGRKISLRRWLDEQYPERQANKVLTPQMVRELVDAYRAVHDGAFPHASSGLIPDGTKTWGAIHAAMSAGLLGWPQAITLSAWLDANYPERTARTLLTPEMVRGWVDAYRAQHGGAFPTVRSGAVPGTDRLWSWVGQAMRTGACGWAPKTPLSAWLDAQYPEERRPLAFSEAQLLEWVSAYRALHQGVFPTATSGRVDGTDQTWRAVATALRMGWSGLGRKITLAAWIEEHFPVQCRGPNGRA